MDWYVINFLGDLVMYVLLWLCSFTYVLLCSLLLVGLYVIFALSWFIVFYSSSGTFFYSVFARWYSLFFLLCHWCSQTSLEQYLVLRYFIEKSFNFFVYPSGTMAEVESI